MQIGHGRLVEVRGVPELQQVAAIGSSHPTRGDKDKVRARRRQVPPWHKECINCEYQGLSDVHHYDVDRYEPCCRSANPSERHLRCLRLQQAASMWDEVRKRPQSTVGLYQRDFDR